MCCNSWVLVFSRSLLQSQVDFLPLHSNKESDKGTNIHGPHTILSTLSKQNNAYWNSIEPCAFCARLLSFCRSHESKIFRPLNLFEHPHSPVQIGGGSPQTPGLAIPRGVLLHTLQVYGKIQPEPHPVCLSCLWAYSTPGMLYFSMD